MFFLLPFGNDRQTSRFPVITYLLMAVNIAVFLPMFLAMLAARPIDQSIIKLLVSPFDPNIIGQFGFTPASPTLTGIFTSMFVHAGILHLAWNMLFLWLFGPNVEDALGRVRYAGVYIVSGLAAAVLHIVVVRMFIPAAMNMSVVGASGAIAGILGIFAIRFYKTGIKIFYYVGILFYPLRWGTFTVSAMIGLGVWFVQQVISGFYSILNPTFQGVAYWSHIGGMGFGMLLAYALQLRVEGTKEYLREDARASMEKGTTWHAAEHLRALLDHDPQNAEVQAELAKTYALQHDPEHSIMHYGRSIELYLRNGQFEQAVATFGELKHFYRNARLDLRSEYQLARYLVDVECPEPALRLFTDIISTYPDMPEAEVAMLKAGDLYLYTLDNPECALQYYERFVADFPHSTWRHTVDRSIMEARKRLQTP